MTRLGVSSVGRRLSLLLVLAVAGAGLLPSVAAGDLDTLAGGAQPAQPPAGQAAEQDGEPTQEAAQALASVEPANLNPLLGSFLLPQWKDDKKPDLWVGQGQLFLKNQDPTRSLCNVVYTIRINFAQEQMMEGVHNMSILGTYATDMHQDLVWLRGKFPKWMPRLGPQQQINIGYTISAPASSLPSPGQFFVETASFCGDGDGAQQQGAKEAVAGVLTPIVGGHGRRTKGRRMLRREQEQEEEADKAPQGGNAVAALESWAAVDDNFLQNPVDGRWYVQAQTRLNNTDTKAGRCAVAFKVGLENASKTPGGGAADVRVEEGYLVNATVNAQGELEGSLAPKFNRIPPGRYVNVAYVLSAPTKEALALGDFTITGAEVC